MRILAIEPDPERREELRTELARRFPIDVVAAVSPEASEQEFGIALPTIVLLSALTPHSAEEHVMRQLEQHDPDGIVPVLTVPPFVADGGSTAASSKHRSAFLKRPHAPIVQDPELVMGHIGETLARLRDESSRPGTHPAERTARRFDIRRATDHQDSIIEAMIRIPAPAPTESSFARARLARASRMTPDELPYPFSLRTANGVVVRLLNLSTTGVLFESSLKFMPGIETSLHLIGPESSTALPSRFVRSEVSAVEARGVTYRTAVQFNRELDIFASVAPGLERPAATMRAIADLLVSVTSCHSAKGDYAGARAAFEAGIRKVLPACEVALRDSPVKPPTGRESVFFSVPTPWGAVLQATFRANQAPSAEEFTLLKVASAAAAVILQFEAVVEAKRTA